MLVPGLWSTGSLGLVFFFRSRPPKNVHFCVGVTPLHFVTLPSCVRTVLSILTYCSH